MVEKEIAEISWGIFIFILLVYFALLFYTLGDKPMTYFDPNNKPYTELKIK